MDGDKITTKDPDATELSDSGKYNHLPEETATSNMVGHKGEEVEGKHSPEGGKLLAGEDGVATEVKFISASGDSQNNGDANISIEAVKMAFTGMGKEELMKFANDPFWIRLRWLLFVVFWLLWAAMLAVAIAIIVMAPKCASPAPKTWWEESPLYQIDVPSFKDGSKDQDGKGDLKGIKEKLDYFVDMGVKGVILSSIMNGSGVSPDRVENFIDIDPAFGTMEDFESLTKEMTLKGIRVAMRFVPNHSSTSHPWFLKSIKNEDPYTDYYIWAERKGTDSEGHAIPPNNWVSVNGDSAWEFNSERNKFYLHQFGSDQPDLNFHNENVIREFKDIFKFWIEKGVSGFILENADFLLEDKELKNETPNTHSKETHTEYGFYNHYQTRNLNSTIDLLSMFKAHIMNLTKFGMLGVTANVSPATLIQYYGEDSKSGVDLPFFSGITSTLNKDINATTLSRDIEEWFFKIPNETWPNWELGNGRMPRLASRVSRDMVDGMHMVFMLLSGTPITYYGDELALEGDAQLPMPWSNSTNGGFSDASELSVPASESYPWINVENQKSANESHYKVFKALTEARKSPSIMYGSRHMHVINETVLAYNRVYSGSPGYLVLFNMGTKNVTVNLSLFSGVPDDVTVLIRSVGFGNANIQVKSKLQSNAVPMPSHGALVLTYVPSKKDE